MGLIRDKIEELRNLNTITDNIVDGAPAALDTLNELAAALGDDENFASSVTNSLAAKADQSTTYTKTEVDSALANLEAYDQSLNTTDNVTFGVVTATSFSGDGSALTGIDSLPTQTGETGKFLTTDGTNASWAEVNYQMLGDATVKAISYNAQSIAENITIPQNTNAYSVGNLTIEDGYTITIEDGSTYKVL